ncbi:hypothetical protein J7K50_00300 [bacterium]|nr:hypothetical protein [bacterium]
MRMYIDAAKLEDEVSAHLIRHDYDLVDFQVRRGAQGTLYRIFIDRIDLAPVKLEDCEKIALPLKLFLTSLGVFGDNTQIEVSSPGFDRILKRDQDFERFRGRRVRVRFRDGDSKRTIVGILSGFDSERLEIESLENCDEDRLFVVRRDLIEVRLVSEV